MVNEKSIFSVTEHKEYVNQSAMWLIEYLKYLDVLEQWFQEINENLPLPCRTNYRDAWFHYKKIFEHRNYTKVIQEQYALEEHLIRAIKDAISSYFQIYTYDMEVVYRAIKTGKLKREAEKGIPEVVKRHHLPLEMEGCWELKLYAAMEERGLEDDFPQVACYICAKKLDMEQTAGALQQCLHNIKNYCARLRLDGTEIYRPANNEEYLEECERVYDGLMEALEKLRLKNVLNVLASEYQRESYF